MLSVVSAVILVTKPEVIPPIPSTILVVRSHWRRPIIKFPLPIEELFRFPAAAAGTAVAFQPYRGRAVIQCLYGLSY